MGCADVLVRFFVAWELGNGGCVVSALVQLQLVYILELAWAWGSAVARDGREGRVPPTHVRCAFQAFVLFGKNWNRTWNGSNEE